jgi:hypothetical protein
MCIERNCQVLFRLGCRAEVAETSANAAAKATCPAKSYYTFPIHDSGFSSFRLIAPLNLPRVARVNHFLAARIRHPPSRFRRRSMARLRLSDPSSVFHNQLRATRPRIVAWRRGHPFAHPPLQSPLSPRGPRREPSDPGWQVLPVDELRRSISRLRLYRPV